VFPEQPRTDMAYQNRTSRSMQPDEKRIAPLSSTPVLGRCFLGSLLACSPLQVIAADASTYPTKPIRMIVPFTAGSGSDTVARVLAPRLLDVLGQRVIVDNRPGAGSTIGTALVAAATADGHTLLLTSSGFAGSASLYANLPYDPVKDFVAITPVMSTALLLVVSPATGVKSTKELIAAARQKQGKMTYASTGVGSGTHYGADLFRRAAGFDAIHVPYKGVPEALNDTMTARVDFYFPPILAALPLLRDGRLVALGTTSEQRLRALPNVPTIAEAGLPEFSYVGWWGMLAPEKTPRAVLDRLSNVLRQVLAESDIRGRLESLGGESYWTPPAEFARIIRTEIVNRARIFGDGKSSVQ